MNDFYLTRLTHQTKATGGTLFEAGTTTDLTSNNLFQKKRGLLENLLEKSLKDFDQNMKKQVNEHLFLAFNLEVRSFFESQTSKSKSMVKSLLLSFEKTMYCFAEVEQSVTAYKVL